MIARDAYPGIDLVARGSGAKFEYDFVVHPETSVDLIRLRFEGARRVWLEDGELWMEQEHGTLRQKPVVFQEVQGKQAQVEVSYRLDNGEVRIATGDYDRGLPLIIDPVVVWAAGSPGFGGVSRIAVGRDGRSTPPARCCRTVPLTLCPRR